MDLPPSLVRLAACQDGIVTRQQALQHGLTVAAVRHLLGRGGRWQRMVTGVYATFTGPLQERHLIRAGLLFAGPSAMVTGTTACRAYGLKYVPASGRPELLVPERVQRARIPIARIRRTRILPAARQVRSFPCAPPERALEDVMAGCRSAPECELRDLLSGSHVLPEARWNHPLPDPRGAGLVPDARLDEARLVIEIDSVEWHRFGETPEMTERRRARLAALGWTVLPVSPRRIREEPVAVLGEIEAAYLAGIARAGRRPEAV